MPTQIIKPASQGTYSQMALSTGPTKWQAMRDSDGWYLVSGNVQIDSYNNDQLPPNVSKIVSVSIAGQNRTGAQAGTSYQFQNMMRFSGSNWFGTTRTTGVNQSWVVQTDSNVPTAPDSSAWSVAVVNATELGTRRLGEVGKTSFHNYINMSVVYELPGGGFALFVSQLIPPLLAVASHGLSKLDVSQILQRCKIRPTNDEDFARILEGFRRRPVYCFAERPSYLHLGGE